MRRSRHADFVAFVLDQLRSLDRIEVRAMFGGHGIYQDGAFFAIVAGGRLYFRTSEATRREYRERDMAAFRPNARQTLSSYYEVPPEILEDPAALTRWARQAVATREVPESSRRSGSTPREQR